jgi:hypothetical protein
MQHFAADSDALRNDQARLTSAFDALAEERRAIDSDRGRIQEREAEQAGESERINSLKTQLERDAQRVEMEQRQAEGERARLTAELQEVTAILAQLRTDRQKLMEESQKMAEQRAELAAESMRVSQQQTSVARALDELENRNEDLLHRREQLKAEQAYLRSGKRQFQGALDEFRAEQIRFRQAVSAIKANRKGFSRRREARAELQAIRASHWAIPLKSEWILDDDLEGLSDEDGPLLGVLDIGENGRIYVLEDRKSNRRVAVRIASVASDDAPRAERIENVWRENLEIRHQNLVQTLRVDRRNSYVRRFTEYVESINLRELMALHGSLSWREAASYGFQAALALEALHQAGRVHGRVVPSHVLIESDGSLRLLPPSAEEVDLAALRNWSGETATPEIVDYLAPEHLRDDSTLDARADLYQLGCILYLALAGHVPFPVETVPQKLEFHMTKLPPPLRRAVGDCPKDLLLAVKRLMAKQPTERYPTATEAAQALAPFARRRPAWFSFESVLASRAERATRGTSSAPPEPTVRVSATMRAEQET